MLEGEKNIRMELFIVCFFNEDNILEEVYCPKSSKKHELNIHLQACIDMELDVILTLPKDMGEGFFEWSQKSYWYAIERKAIAGKMILFITDAEVAIYQLKAALDSVPVGIQLFDENGMMRYMNQSCEQIEFVELENVKGKHLLDIYDVDREYSTILNTLKTGKEVQNRYGFFQNCNGKEVRSLNTGIPVFLEDRLIGAVGNVYDLEVLDEIEKKKEIILKNQEKEHKALKIHGHKEKKYSTFDDIIGESEELKSTIELAEKVAVKDSSVLLWGETGVGKEVFAQSIHSASPRKDKEFVAINCAALPSGIIESLLFGTVKGAFTGSTDKKGLLESAEGGTIFLDEINSMEINLQAKLLRVIQEKRFHRVGDVKQRSCDVRFVSAMNESPEESILNQHLRSDLYYRLATISIEIAPLRKRKEDILPLSNWQLKKLSRKYFKRELILDKEVQEILENYKWPGNVRELFQVLEYACNFAKEDRIRKEDLPKRMLHRLERKEVLNLNKDREVHREPIEQTLTQEYSGTLNEKLLYLEKKIIEEELGKNQYNISKTAKELGIGRQNLQYRMKKCGIRLCRTLEK